MGARNTGAGKGGGAAARRAPPSRTPESVYAATLDGVSTAPVPQERRYAAGGYGCCGGRVTVGDGVCDGDTEADLVGDAI